MAHGPNIKTEEFNHLMVENLIAFFGIRKYDKIDKICNVESQFFCLKK